MTGNQFPMNNFTTDKSAIDRMYRAMADMPVLYRPSAFWTDLDEQHRKQLESADLNNFKRTINVRYFNWRTLGILRHQMRPIWNAFLKFNFDPLLKSRFINPSLIHTKEVTHFNALAAIIYRVYIASLYEYVKKDDRLRLLDAVSEPSLGNPFLVEYKGGLRTQDLCNSVHEFYSVMNHASFNRQNISIAELGAGYGRTAYVFLKALPQANYCIIDIPPALYVAQEYLSKVFAGEKIFAYRPFNDFETVKDEFNNARIRFLMPDQIELLPPGIFDLTLNISSLHEMAREQIDNFINQINRVCREYFYTKQWRRSRIKDNGHIRMNEYPIPPLWKEVYKRTRHPIQGMFFDALYKL